LRTLLIHGGRSVSRVAHKHEDKHHLWISDIKRRRGENISNVAVANKNARIADQERKLSGGSMRAVLLFKRGGSSCRAKQ